MNILAIDPGNIDSAYVIMRSEDYKPLNFGKVGNEHLLDNVIPRKCCEYGVGRYAIERVACYGMPVGREIFDTCEWIGRFSQQIRSLFAVKPDYVLRMDEKMAVCHNANAGDANIRRALIDRFAKHDLKNGKGTKKDPDWFYGFKADVWTAYAVGFTYLKRIERETYLVSLQ